MARFRDTGDETTDDTEVDISPLIDCVFILLIFFIVTTTIVEESGLAVDKPQAAPEQQTDDEDKTIILELTKQGRVLHEGNEIGLSGVRPLVEDRLREKEVPVIVRSARAATVDRLVRIIDEARLGGAEKVSVSESQSGS
jgi:biopolymer transport protein ExbD